MDKEQLVQQIYDHLEADRVESALMGCLRLSSPGRLWLFSLMWSRADILGLFSIMWAHSHVNVVLSGPLFSINVVRKSRCFWARRFMFSVRYTYTYQKPPKFLSL